jgi:hypothetical protein
VGGLEEREEGEAVSLGDCSRLDRASSSLFSISIRALRASRSRDSHSLFVLPHLLARMWSSCASSTSSSRSTVIAGGNRSSTPDDPLALTTEALNRLNLARPSTPDEPVHHWTIATREENTSYASSIVEGYVLDPSSLMASKSDKLEAYRSLIVQFGELEGCLQCV